MKDASNLLESADKMVGAQKKHRILKPSFPPKEYFDWLILALEYLTAAQRLAKDVKKKRRDFGPKKYGVVVPLYLFRHGLELALKCYSICFGIPVVRKHDVELVGLKISQLLPTLDTENMEASDEPVKVKLPVKMKLRGRLRRNILLRNGYVMGRTLKVWEKKLPEIVAKYKTHSYVKGYSRKDEKNSLLRYPDDLVLKDKIESMTDSEWDTVIEDMYDQFMLLQFVLHIRMKQPLESVGSD